MRYAFYPNRTLCSVLDEMRKLHETRNYSILPSLIEEAQTLANRMEASLGDKNDIAELTDIRSNLRKEVKELTKDLKKLRQLAGKKDEATDE